MASKSLPLSTILIFSLLLCSALANPCGQPKTQPAPVPVPELPPAPAPVEPRRKPPIPKINPPTSSSPEVQPSYCPKDTVQFGACSDILGTGSVIGSPVSNKCCALLTGMTNAEAVACLCSAIKSNVLGMDLNIPVSFSLLANYCQKTVPTSYQCK